MRRVDPAGGARHGGAGQRPHHAQLQLAAARRAARGGVLRLAGDCDRWLGGHCHVDYEISVPPGTGVSVDVGSGDTRIDALRSTRPLVAHGGSGDLDLRDVSAPSVDLRVGSGDITSDLGRRPSVRSGPSSARGTSCSA